MSISTDAGVEDDDDEDDWLETEVVDCDVVERLDALDCDVVERLEELDCDVVESDVLEDVLALDCDVVDCEVVVSPPDDRDDSDNPRDELLVKD